MQVEHLGGEGKKSPTYIDWVSVSIEDECENAERGDL